MDAIGRALLSLELVPLNNPTSILTRNVIAEKFCVRIGSTWRKRKNHGKNHSRRDRRKRHDTFGKRHKCTFARTKSSGAGTEHSRHKKLGHGAACASARLGRPAGQTGKEIAAHRGMHECPFAEMRPAPCLTKATKEEYSLAWSALFKRATTRIEFPLLYGLRWKGHGIPYRAYRTTGNKQPLAKHRIASDVRCAARRSLAGCFRQKKCRCRRGYHGNCVFWKSLRATSGSPVRQLLCWK